MSTQSLGIRVKDSNSIDELFPSKIGDLAKQTLDIIEKVPSASTPDDYIVQYIQQRANLRHEEKPIAEFAKLLHLVSRKVVGIAERESFVDQLVGFLLQTCDFNVDPMTLILQPKFFLQYGTRQLVSIPDWAVSKTVEIGLPVIVAVGIENKKLHGETGLGQAIGSSVVTSLVNLETLEKSQPVAMVRARGPYLSFMKASYSREFLESIIAGEIPKHESAVLVFPKRPPSGAHVGLNLLKAEERKLAFEALYKLRAFALDLPH